MKIRESRKEDEKQITKLAEKYNIDIPSEGTIIVAENGEGKIEAFVNIRSVIFVEPFICENPLLGNKLWDYIKKKSSIGGVKILRCFAQHKHKKLYKKLGFYEIFNDMTAMEINFWKGD